MELTIEQALQQAVEAHKAGKLQDAEAFYRAILQAQPKHPDANHNLGVLAVSVNKPEAALPLFKTALEANPSQGQFWLSYIDALIKEKQFDNARNLLEQGKKAGLAGEKVDALEAHLATSLLVQNPESPLPTKKNPTFKQQRKKVSSKKEKKKNSSSNQKNLNQARSPSQAEVNALLENYQKRQYDLSENLAKDLIQKYPDHQFSWKVLGAVFNQTGRLQDSLTANQRAVEISPNDTEAHSNLGNTLKELGRLEDALVTAIKSIEIKSTVEAKSLFIDLTKKIGIQNWDQSMAQVVITALLDPWGRPSDLMSFACRLLRVDKELVNVLNQSKKDDSQSNYDESFLDLIIKKEFAASSLLDAMLSSSHIPDAEIEIFLSSLRRHLLKVAASVILKEDETEEVATFYCYLAQQCFINEYVYFQTQEEIERSHQLLNQLTKALDNKQKNIPVLWVISVACYFPLYSVEGAEKLLHRKWSENVKSVLKQQIEEPLKELNLRASIGVITSIESQVSLAVQSQYEENPYPRWVRLPKDSSKKFLNAYMQSKFPLSPFRRLVDDRNIEILIAGLSVFKWFETDGLIS